MNVSRLVIVFWLSAALILSPLFIHPVLAESATEADAGVSSFELTDQSWASPGVTFNLSYRSWTQPHPPLSTWRLAIMDAHSRILFSTEWHNPDWPIGSLVDWDGTDFRDSWPKQYHWDGRSNDGRFLGAGRYSFSLAYEYATGGKDVNGGSFMLISPEEQAGVEEPPYPPPPSTIVTDHLPSGVGGTIEIKVPHLPFASMYNWQVQIRSKDGGYVYTQDTFGLGLAFPDKDTFPGVAIAWDGRDNQSHGRLFPDGEYEITFWFWLTGDKLPRMVGRQTVGKLQISPRTDDVESPVDNADSVQADSTPRDSSSAEDSVEDEQSQNNQTVELYPEHCVDRRPILLIHGLNSSPGTWMEPDRHYVNMLREWGYSDQFIGLYFYSGQGNGPGGYNNEGSVIEVSAGMRRAVESLRNVSLGCGGSGLVDILAFSMGGLVAREYVRQWPNDSFLGKVITVGTPYLGSQLLPHSSSDWGDQLQFWPGTSLVSQSFVQISADSPAIVDLRPGSDWIIKSQSFVAKDIEYFLLFGDIQRGFAIRLFNLEVRGQGLVQLGDILVSSDSASTLPAGHKVRKFAYMDYQWQRLPLELVAGPEVGFVYMLAESIGSLVESPFEHGRLIRSGLVKARIKHILLDGLE